MNKPCKNCGSIGGNVGCDVCEPALRAENLSCDSFRPDNINPVEFRCRDCGEWHAMAFERAIPNGQWGVNVGRNYCIVGCFCTDCWKIRERKAHVRGRLTIYDYAKQTSANGGPKLRQTRD